jgi:hypothetical protein
MFLLEKGGRVNPIYIEKNLLKKAARMEEMVVVEVTLF